MEKEAEYRLCNIAIWIFFFLLIFEGAFRKWILPSLSDVFLIIRDPLAIFVVFMACKHCGLARNKFVITAWAIALITTITALLFGHQNLFIALYGARIWVYYIPLIFAIPHFLLAKDVVLMFNWARNTQCQRPNCPQCRSCKYCAGLDVPNKVVILELNSQETAQ